MKTTVTELEGSRVRVEAEVSADTIETAVNKATRALGKDLRMPGFRKGKVPAPVVLQRFGREVVVDEAVRASLNSWYAEALRESAIHPIGDPELKLEDLPGAGEPLSFSFEIGVRPTATLGDYKGVAVEKPSSAPDDGAVDAELETLRERQARLDTVEEAAADGDFVVVDYAGSIDGELFEGGQARDQMIELGGGRLIPGFEEGLVGAAAGDERTLELTFPDDYPQPDLAGKATQFEVSVKEVKRKQLADLDDAFAEQAAGFDTLAELREDITAKLTEDAERQAEAGFREAVLDAVVANATVEVPEPLVEARARELWDRMLHSLSHQGINKELYLQISGRTEEDLLGEAKPDAEQGIKREAVLVAVVAAESLVAADGDVLDALQAPAARENIAPEKLREQLEKAGRLEELREDIVQQRALDLIVEQAKPLDAAEEKAAPAKKRAPSKAKAAKPKATSEPKA